MDAYLKALIPLGAGLALIALAPVLGQDELAKTGLVLVAAAVAVWRVPNRQPEVENVAETAFVEHGLPDVEVDDTPPPDKGNAKAAR